MRRVIGVFAVVVVALAIGGILAFRAFLPAEKVRRMAAEAAGEALGLPVSLDEARASVFPLGVSVRGLRVANRAFEAPPLLELREARASVRFLPLLSRRIEISRVRAAGVGVAVVIERKTPGAEGDGGEAAEPGVSPASPFALLVPSLEIEECTVRILDAAAGTETVLDSVTARTSVRVGANGGPVDASGEIRIARVRAPQLAAVGLPGGIGGIEVGCDLVYRPDEGIAEVRDLRVSMKKLVLTLKGIVTGIPAAPQGALTIATPAIELGDLLSLLPAARAGEFEGSGPLSVEGDVRFGPGSTLAYRLAFSLEGLDVRNVRYPGRIEGCRGRIEATERGIVIENLTATVAGKPLFVSGTVTNLADPVLDLSVQGEVDLGALAEAGLLPRKMGAGGSVRLDIRANGPAKRRGDLSLEGTVRFDRVAVAIERPPVRVDGGCGAISLRGKTAETTDCIFDFNGSSTNVTGSVRNFFGEATYALDLQTRKIDLNAFLPPPGESGGAPARGEVPIVFPPLPPVTATGRVRVDTVLTGPNVLTGVDAKLDLVKGRGVMNLGLAHAVFGGVRVRGARSDLRLENGALAGSLSADSAIAYRVPLTSVRGRIAVAPPADVTLDGLVAKAYRGSVSGDAHVTVDGPGRAVYRFAARAESLEANDFLSSLTPVRDVLFGGFSLESKWEGNGLTEAEFLRGLTASGTMRAENGEIRNLSSLRRVSSLLGMKEMETVRFREMWSGFSISNGRLLFDDLRIASADADWRIAGSVGFDGTLDYDVSVTLSDEVSDRYRRKTALAELLADDSGRVVLDFGLAGTTREPVVTYDASKTAGRAGVRNVADLMQTLGGEEKVRSVLDNLLGGGKKEETGPDTAEGK